MKRFTVLFLVFVMMFTMVIGAHAEKDNSEITIACAFAEQTEGQYKLRLDYEAYAKELGINWIWTDANSNLNKQLADIDSLVAQKPDAMIIVACDRDGIVPIAEQVNASGIPVIDGLYSINSDNITSHCVIPLYDRGVIQAQLLKQWLEEHPGEKLKIAMLRGMSGQGSTDIKQGFMDNFSDVIERGDAEIITEMYSENSADRATAIAEDWLTAYGDEINCIYGEFDEICLSAINVWRSAGMPMGTDKMVFIGADLTIRYHEEIANGVAYGTCWNNFDKIAHIILDIAVAAAKGENVELYPDMASQGCLQAVTLANLPPIEEIKPKE